MINTNLQITNLRDLASAARPEASDLPVDGYAQVEMPRAGFEPWLGGGQGGARPPAGGQVPSQQIPEPVLTIEPWLRGQETDDPSVGPRFADKLTRSFGEQAILSLKDDRVHGAGGYFLEGWEGVGGDDFVSRMALGRLGDKWEMTSYGTFELKGAGVRQELSFDVSSGLTRLESSYEERTYDTTLYSEILTVGRDGVMRRETPPVGL